MSKGEDFKAIVELFVDRADGRPRRSRLTILTKRVEMQTLEDVKLKPGGQVHSGDRQAYNTRRIGDIVKPYDALPNEVDLRFVAAWHHQEVSREENTTC